MKKNKFYQHGFTLIELMNVIAIIGILAAIALPAYQDYIGKAQAIEGVKITSGLRDDIAAYVADVNHFPTAVETGTAGVFGSAAAALDGRYVQQGGVSVAPNTGVITVQYDDGALRGLNLTMTPTLNTSNNTQLIQWQCGGTLGTRFLPSSCQ